MAQIIRITSEALQATIRRLLPSQQGFGEDLQASNIITPVIDVTPTAEGSQLPADFARGMAYGNNAFFAHGGSTQALVNTPGFYRLFGNITVRPSPSALITADIEITDGTTPKKIWGTAADAGASEGRYGFNVDIVVFLDTGETLQTTSSASSAQWRGSVRQIADRYGNITNPVGFTFE